jgi:hypothetical protein
LKSLAAILTAVICGRSAATALAALGDGVVIGHQGQITIAVTGGKPRNLTRAQESWRGDNTPAYSPDGKTIAFARAAPTRLTPTSS